MREPIYLRPGGSPGWGTRSLMGILVTALVLFVFWGSPLYPDALALVPQRAFGALELWRLVTAPLWFGTLDQVRIAPLVLSLLGLWALGSPLERWLGTRRLLILFGAGVLLGHLGAGLLAQAMAPSEALGGPAPGVWAIATALGIHYWNHQTWVIRPLPLRGRHLFFGLTAALAVALLLDWKDGLSLFPFAADALGGAVGALFVTKGWRFWRRRPKSRSRFVVLPGGVDARSHKRSSGKGNGRGRDAAGSPPKTWN